MKKLLLITLATFLIAGCNNQDSVKVTVSNSLDVERSDETIEIPYGKLAPLTEGVDTINLIVTDNKGNEIVSQIIMEGSNTPVSLIFQPVVAAKSNAVYYIKNSTPDDYEQKAYGRFVPERMDDYAWENNRIAFRIYGTALIAKDGPSNGLDVWVKRTEKMVIDKWYSEYLAGKNSYHDDNGEGCDCYKVGRTLGAGAMAPYVNDSLWLGINFDSYQTLDNGPLRTSFRLEYPPFAVDTLMITETRIISLDAGSQLTKITEEYRGFGNEVEVAAGIIEREEGTVLQKNNTAGIIAYRLDAGENGVIYTGTIIPSAVKDVFEKYNHLLISAVYEPGKPLTYYTGAGWSKWGFENDEAWNSYLNDLALKLSNPLVVVIQ